MAWFYAAEWPTFAPPLTGALPPSRSTKREWPVLEEVAIPARIGEQLKLVASRLEAVSERYRNGGRPSFDMIPRGCDTNLGSHHVEPDRPRAS